MHLRQFSSNHRTWPDLDVRTVEARRKVYDTVRSALTRQLKSINPPLATTEISRERLQLEEAIRRVENEIVAEAQMAHDSRDDDAEPRPPDEDDWQSRDTAPSPPPPEHYLKRRIPARSAGRPRQEDVDEEDDAQLSQYAAPRLHLWKILLFAFIVAIIASLGMLAWSQRTMIASLFAPPDDGATDIAAPDPPPASEDRFADERVADPNVRVIGAVSSPDGSRETTANAPADEPSETSDPATGNEGAVLYEQPVDTATSSYVTAIGAGVSWQFVEDAE